MAIYVSRAPKSDWADDDSPVIRETQVYDEGPQDTGLLDARGNKLFRVPDPIGFVTE